MNSKNNGKPDNFENNNNNNKTINNNINIEECDKNMTSWG